MKNSEIKGYTILKNGSHNYLEVQFFDISVKNMVILSRMD